MHSSLPISFFLFILMLSSLALSHSFSFSSLSNLSLLTPISRAHVSLPNLSLLSCSHLSLFHDLISPSQSLSFSLMISSLFPFPSPFLSRALIPYPLYYSFPSHASFPSRSLLSSLLTTLLSLFPLTFSFPLLLSPFPILSSYNHSPFPIALSFPSRILISN